MNPFPGVLFHWMGGFASGSFYVPYKAVKKWSWETCWLVGGFFSWVICPLFFALLMTRDTLSVIRAQSMSTLSWTYLFGALWGIGGLTFWIDHAVSRIVTCNGGCAGILSTVIIGYGTWLKGGGPAH